MEHTFEYKNAQITVRMQLGHDYLLQQRFLSYLLEVGADNFGAYNFARMVAQTVRVEGELPASLPERSANKEAVIDAYEAFMSAPTGGLIQAYSIALSEVDHLGDERLAAPEAVDPKS